MIKVLTNMREIDLDEDKIKVVGRGSKGTNIKGLLKLKKNEEILELK